MQYKRSIKLLETNLKTRGPIKSGNGLSVIGISGKGFDLRLRKAALTLFVGSLFSVSSVFAQNSSCDCEQKNIYPTHVIADYVLGCMAANGNSFASLHQCSCSIDLIMSKVPLEDYEKASTILQVQLDKGQRGIFYRDSSWAKNKLEKFERVQAESTLKCF